MLKTEKVNEHDLALAVLSALRRRRNDPSAEGGWTLPIAVAQEVGATADAVLEEFHVLSADGEVELDRRLTGPGTRARISTKGEDRVARLADAKRTAALRPHTASTATSRKAFKYDVFVSHASEDAAPFVDLLVAEMKRRHLRVWYDRDRIGHGSAMIEMMNDGLRDSRCGVIVASPHYFGKVYTKPETSALLHFAMRDGTRKVLPVLYQMSQDDLLDVHPILANHINIEAAKHDPGQIAAFIAAAVLPQDAARLAEPVARHPLPLGVSPFAPGMHDAPYDVLPEQHHLLAMRPLIQIAWYEADQNNGYPAISWTLTNLGAGNAHDVAVFLPGIASYSAGSLAVGESREERRRFDDRYAYHEHMKPPIQAIVEFADDNGNVYREYGDVEARVRWNEEPAEYKTTLFGHPYPVSGRIVEPDGEKDRFFLTAPLGWDPGPPRWPGPGYNG